VTSPAGTVTASCDQRGLMAYDAETPSDLRAMFDATVERCPEALAVVDDHRSVTYASLRDEVRTLARGFAARGVRQGDRVALLAGNGVPFTAAAWAVWDLGAILVPLNFRLTAADLAAQMADSSATLLLVGETRRALGESLIALTGVEAVHQGSADRFVAHETGAEYDRVPLRSDAPMAILYTSGTTGRPKGVVISHGNAVQNSITCVELIGRRSDDVELVMAPQFNVTGLCSQTIPVVRAGMCMVLLDTFDAAAAVTAIRAHGVTTTVGAPTMWWRLLEAAGDAGLSSLRLALYGGAPMPSALLHRMRAALPGAVFGNGYGMTETCSMLCYVGGSDAIDHADSVGRPLPITELRLLQPKGIHEVPAGEVGEIVVRGSQVAIGYWSPHGVSPLLDEDGWLRTGDAARIVDGFVILADRLKDVIKRAGESVFSIEVEEVLYQHPDILEASVTGVPDPELGERVLAVVVPKPDCEIDADSVRDHCRASLASFKVPSFVVFRSDLPRNAGGKVVKDTLKEEFAARLN